MNHQTVGYIRVSSQSQNTARQLAGIKLDKEFVDVVTGSIKERTNLQACIDYIREGDTLVVDSIDRLARNLRDLQEIIQTIVKKGVAVKFIKENLTFTSQQDPIATLMLHMMGAFAEFERNMIRNRQREGIDLAKKKGKHLGRPPVDMKLSAKVKELKKKGLSIASIGQAIEKSAPTVYKLLRHND
ncbi:recombinase family protein [Legionella micdadei]|uniref:Site-specific DNA recombinase n=1 Tax=Legionella micdadei TaxID=451 RepID=A0A098GG34_LEGMI|nr:recombinase family protein [Legionella micdadei]KTD27564.1 transposase (resolvase, DNA invertase) [Legionella micdadei]CEG60947.1 Transposon Tn21 resolvase [Legionella micdadei]SCY69362.1 Site-specific DNA recombinase [Legionella micdadei]